MTGTKPAGFSYARYLDAKITVEDRSLNRAVVETLRGELARRFERRPLRVLEIGGGIGTMIRRAIEWGILGDADYTLVDADPALLSQGLESLAAWAADAGFSTESARAESLRVFSPTGQLDVRIRTRQAEAFEHLKSEPRRTIDLLIASSFLDLVELSSALDGMLPVLSDHGLFWFPVSYDGDTIFEPAHPSDAAIIEGYHRSMDDRVRYGRPAGQSRTGRKMFGALTRAGAKILAAGSSDGVVHGQGREYPHDERYFVACILSTIEEALLARPDVDRSTLSTWLDARRDQLERGTLSYIAHQLDFAGHRVR
jgi:hypothetical protein